MTKTQFKKMEKVCHQIWDELKVSGDYRKPGYSFLFGGACPACEIDIRTSSQRSCASCHVAVWRNNPCIWNVFTKWDDAKTKRTRQKYAAQIAALKWSWMKEYAEVELRPEVLKYLEGVKL